MSTLFLTLFLGVAQASDADTETQQTHATSAARDRLRTRPVPRRVMAIIDQGRRIFIPTPTPTVAAPLSMMAEGELVPGDRAGGPMP